MSLSTKETTEEKLSRIEHHLHLREIHPDYEYCSIRPHFSEESWEINLEFGYWRRLKVRS